VIATTIAIDITTYAREYVDEIGLWR